MCLTSSSHRRSILDMPILCPEDTTPPPIPSRTVAPLPPTRNFQGFIPLTYCRLCRSIQPSQVNFEQRCTANYQEWPQFCPVQYSPPMLPATIATPPSQGFGQQLYFGGVPPGEFKKLKQTLLTLL